MTQLRPVGVSQTCVYGDNTYSILDAAVHAQSRLACISTSDRRLRIYDLERLAHLHDIRAHTAHITDVVTCAASPNIVYSCQEDVGVLVTDLRQGSAVRYLNELQGQGNNGYSVDISPGANELAVAVGGDVHLVDTRTYAATRVLDTVHTDDITRVRYSSEGIIVTGGEDLMVNVVATHAHDNDMLLCALQFGECLSHVATFATSSSATDSPATLLITGTCENALAMQMPCGIETAVRLLERQAHLKASMRAEIDVPIFAAEKKLPRPTESTYLVDWITVPDAGASGAAAALVFGEYQSELYEADAAAGGTGDAPARPDASVDAAHRSLFSPLRLQLFDTNEGVFLAGPITLANAHRGVVRCARNIAQDRLLTAGEDGLLAVWSLAPSAAVAVGSVDGDASADDHTSQPTASSSASEGKEITRHGTHRRTTKGKPY